MAAQALVENSSQSRKIPDYDQHEEPENLSSHATKTISGR